jgi:cell wall-associated NlpC family hydrolase
MTTLAWLFILAAIVLIRQVSKGRVMNLGEDLSDMFIAVASGDNKGLTDVLSRSGEAATSTVAGTNTDSSTGTISYHGKGNPANGAPKGTPATNVAVLRSAVELGEAAKGYRFAATGPDYYDCSGLMWRACQKAGYTGARFTTATIGLSKKFQRLADPSLGVSQVTVGDIVVWPGHHMGVVSTAGKFYSARSLKTGIGTSDIAGFGGFGKPIYYRLVP